MTRGRPHAMRPSDPSGGRRRPTARPGRSLPRAGQNDTVVFAIDIVSALPPSAA